MRCRSGGRDSARRPCSATAAMPSPRYSTTSRGTIGQMPELPIGIHSSVSAAGAATMANGMSRRPRAREHDHERGEIDRERDDPQERRRDEVGRHQVRDGGQQAGRNGGERNPPEPQAARGRLHVASLVRHEVGALGRDQLPGTAEPRRLNGNRKDEQPEQYEHPGNPQRALLESPILLSMSSG